MDWWLTYHEHRDNSGTMYLYESGREDEGSGREGGGEGMVAEERERREERGEGWWERRARNIIPLI